MNEETLPDTLEEIQRVLNPKTGRVELARLPQTKKTYRFGPEWIEYLSGEDITILAIEHELSIGGAGRAKRLRNDCISLIQEAAASRIDPQGGIKPEYLETHPGETLAAWNERHIKFHEKQRIKKEAFGVNVTNLPYRAGPNLIKKFLEEAIGRDGAILAMDPWWSKEGWVHDGGVTVYTKEDHARKLIELGKEGLCFRWNDPPMNRRLTITPGPDRKLGTDPRAISDPWD